MRRVAALLVFLVSLALVWPAPSPLWASAEGGHGGGAHQEGGKDKDKNKIENGILKYGPLTVNVLSNKGYHILRLSMQIQCTDNAAAERLTKPDVREALILFLSTRLAEDLLSPTGKMVLREDLEKLFAKYAGQKELHSLYFTEFVIQ